MESGPEATEVHRLILSGAAFTDDRARDARRGLAHSPISMTALLKLLLGDGHLIAYCEEGHPHEVPEGASGIEHHTVARPGGSLREWRVRWHKAVESAEEIDAAAQAGADVFLRITAPPESPAAMIHESPLIPPLADDADNPPSLYGEDLARALFFLTGFRAAGRPNRYFQPWGIPAVLDQVDAVALLHRDKHGPALGLYTRDAVDLEAILQTMEAAVERPLLVPFAIPPMLARWDRALWDLRQHWNTDERGEFPVPAAARQEGEEEVPPEEILVEPDPVAEPEE